MRPATGASRWHLSPAEQRAAARNPWPRPLRPVRHLLWVMVATARSAASALALHRSLAARMERRLGGRPGIFVEAGANDGVSQSNTVRLQRAHGWHGLLVEPLPALYEECVRNRPGAIVRRCALVAPDFEGDEVELHAADLYSVVRGSRDANAESLHLATARQIQKLHEVPVVRAPARTLSSLLDEHGLTHVDFLSLDVEGYEPQALRGLDLKRHRPHWMLIEGGDRPDIHAILDDLYDVVQPPLTPFDTLFRLRGQA